MEPQLSPFCKMSLSNRSNPRPLVIQCTQWGILSWVWPESPPNCILLLAKEVLLKVTWLNKQGPLFWIFTPFLFSNKALKFLGLAHANETWELKFKTFGTGHSNWYSNRDPFLLSCTSADMESSRLCLGLKSSSRAPFTSLLLGFKVRKQYRLCWTFGPLSPAASEVPL